MKNNKLKSFISDYPGNFATYMCALFLGVYPIFYFFISFVSNNFFLHWNMYLLLIFPIMIVAGFFLQRLIRKDYSKMSTLAKTNALSFWKNKELLFLSLFMLWSLLATFLSQNVVETFWGINGSSPLEGWICFAFYAICFYVGFKIRQVNYQRVIIYLLLFVSLIVNILTFIDPFNNIFPAFVHSNTIWASMFVNSNHYGYYLTICIMLAAGLFLTEKNKILKYTSLLIYILHTIQLALNNTLGSNLALLVTLIAIIIIISIRNKKFNWQSLILLGIYLLGITFLSTNILKQLIELFAVDFSNIARDPQSDIAAEAGTTRWGLWMSAFEIIRENPWFGNGDTGFRPHNEYIQYAQVWGIPSLIFYIIGIAFIIFRSLKNIRKISDTTLVLLFACLGYLVSALFGNTMPHVMPYFCLLLGMLSFSSRMTKDEKLQDKQNNTNKV